MKPKLTLNHDYTANGKLMSDDRVLKSVLQGIDNPSDAIIPAQTSLYRAAHRFLRDRTTGIPTKTTREQAFASPWWTTYWDFNQIAWATNAPDQAAAVQDASAIHRGWGGDCSLYASIVTAVDLSVWYGLGKSVVDTDLMSPQLSIAFASQDILQIFIPGFWDHAQKWTTFKDVMAFPTGLSNGQGFQGNQPAPFQHGAGSTQLSLFGM